MPKILINEKDYTSPGAAGDYSNFAVLITGFTGTNFKEYDPEDESTYKDLVKPDYNGVYEFDSQSDFVNTIGLREPKMLHSNDYVYHYGNQMAYELLGMGYNIIYKPITVNDINDQTRGITTEAFWEIFKDKSSYDFRFITHGFLEDASYVNTEEDKARIEKIEEAIDALKAIEELVSAKMVLDSTIVDKADALDSEYLNIKDDYEGFKVETTTTEGEGEDATEVTEMVAYLTYQIAKDSTEAELKELKEKAEISLRTTMNLVNKQIANLAKYVATTADSQDIPGRGDCIALIELNEKAYVKTSTEKAEKLIINAIREMSDINETNGAYCAMTVPSVVYAMSDYGQKDANDESKGKIFDNNKKFPGAFHYLACFKNSLDQGFREWYAAAGYTRGVSSYTIDYTTVKLGEIAINALEPRNTDGSENSPKFACNVIAGFRGSYYLWGNRTCHPLGDVKGNKGDLVASHFLNIRQLCTTIKKQLYVACRRFTFDPNSDALWVNFCNAIRPTLDEMKADQGIRDYKIIKVTDNPKKATLRAKIRIIPIEAVEDFDLEVSLEDSFGETVVTV